VRRISYPAVFLATVILLIQILVDTGQALAQAPSKTDSAKPATPALSGVPTEKEIADAKAKGFVWTNPTTKVYHKGGEFYGKTKNGKFMSEADAIRQYYRPSPDAMKKADASKALPPPPAKTAAAAQSKKK